ncbi:hypothetical protein KIN20_018490 [Parelaphostrongylus tenuis]|uniref:Uncharacterized protein n=1 Tax=Parelaphostrongylus tenuis TaxID=148309 RepID=A0AAD5N238_PARTN|nr:hypothetical protein KIN20_018490 [Parelaphostrongylus tenuis]
MNVLINISKFPTDLFMSSLLAIISIELECGVIPAGKVLDALERQARSAFLPDAVISTILGQLNVNITY